MPLNPTDLFDIRSLLSEEERAVQDAVARFTDEKVIPIIGDAFDQGRFPKELVPEIASMGLLGSSLPEQYGCAGLNAVSYGLICQELERGDSGIRSFVSVQSSLCMYPIYAYGSEEQRQRYLPGMAKAEIIGCFGLTEPHGGSDPANMKTTAKKDGGDWVINGAKMWITNGNLAHIAIVWAQTDDGIQGFIVPTDTKGFTAQEIHRKMSLRASVTSALFFDNVRIPDSQRLPNVKGLKGPLELGLRLGGIVGEQEPHHPDAGAAQRPGVQRRPIVDLARIGLDRSGVQRVGTGDDAEHNGGVLDRGGDRPGGVLRMADRHDVGTRHQTHGRLEPDHAIDRGRTDDGAVGLGADGGRCQTHGHRRCAARRRAARRSCRIIGVQGLPPDGTPAADGIG